MSVEVNLDLVFPDSFRLSSATARQMVCNGAGPRRFGWLVPDTIWGLSITDAANIHDWMYWKGRTEADRLEADVTFLVNMCRLIEMRSSNRAIHFLRRWRAMTYFSAVRDFGGKAFYDKVA
jgi:hypothetical protein